MLPITALLYGALAASAALILESILFPVALGPILLLFAALIEEGSKFAFLLQWQKRFSHTSWVTLQTYFSLFCFGLGFALVELTLATPPSITILLSLAGTHLLTVMLLGQSILSKSLSLPLRASIFMVAVALHVAYNLFFATLQ